MAELATIYQLKEKENEIQQQHEQIQKTIIIRNLLAGAFGLVCLYYGWLGITSAPSRRKTD